MSRMRAPARDKCTGIERNRMDGNARSVTPSISVVIPAHNEEQYIGDCIASVLGTGWPREKLEVLVIDHSSTDLTGQKARVAGAEVLHLTKGRIGAVRNAGLAAAKGEFIAYVDGDCEVPPTWLRTAIGLIDSDRLIGAVGGPCLSPARGTWVERSLAPSVPPAGPARRVSALATSSFIARTSLLRNAGGFDESLVSGEDDDMSNRLRSRGLELVSASDCHIVHHGFPKTWWDALKKEIWHGSHHIEVRTRFDPTLILTFAFLAASIALPALLAAALLAPGFKSRYALSADLFLQFAPPLLFASKRIRQSPRDWRMILPLVSTGYAYFAGHALGVLTNLWQRVMPHPRESTTVTRSD